MVINNKLCALYINGCLWGDGTILPHNNDFSAWISSFCNFCSYFIGDTLPWRRKFRLLGRSRGLPEPLEHWHEKRAWPLGRKDLFSLFAPYYCNYLSLSADVLFGCYGYSGVFIVLSLIGIGFLFLHVFYHWTWACVSFAGNFSSGCCWLEEKNWIQWYFAKCFEDLKALKNLCSVSKMAYLDLIFRIRSWDFWM